MATRKKAEKTGEKALAAALKEIEQKYDKGAIMRLGEDQFTVPDGISTGCLSLDIALGGTGIPRGRVVEIYGPEASGKTTLSLQIVADAQKQGGIAAFIDAEHAIDPVYARRLGVNTDDLLISQPDCGEQALDIAETLVRSSGVDVIVIDSVAALVPRAELEGEMGDHFVGLHARLMSQALRKLTGSIAKSKTTVIFINQIREKIGVMFGSPETTTGGRALKFYASVRIDVRRIGQIKDGENNIGNRTKATVVKNKMAPPFRRVEFDILFGLGISTEGDLIDLGIEHGVVMKSGAWFSCIDKEGADPIRLGQGREAARTMLKDNPDLSASVEAAIRKSLGIGEEDKEPEATEEVAEEVAEEAVTEEAVTEEAAEPVSTG